MTAFIRKHAAVCAAGAWLLLLCALVWLAVPAGYDSVNLVRPFEIGENWIYALRPAFDNNLFPYFPTLLAFLQYHLPAWLQYAAVRALFMLPALLAFSAGVLAHSLRAGLFSGSLAAALSCFLLLHGELQYEQHAEQVLVASAMLMLAGGAALKLRKPLKSFLVGLLLAAAVYIKGVLIICVPALMVSRSFNGKARARARDWWPAAAVLVGCLSIWTLLNMHSLNQFVLLEGRGRSEGMIAGGAAGLVATMEGDWRSLPDIPRSGNRTLWALRVSALQPLRFTGIVAARVKYLSQHSLPPPMLACLSLLFLAGLFRLRKRREAWPLIFMALSFISVHLFFPIEPRYFVPVWFLMCAIAGMGLADMSKPGDGSGEAAGRAVFMAAVLPLAVFLLFVLGLTASFPLRLPRADLRELIAANPHSPYLYSEAGRSSEEAGDFKAAAGSYLKAYELEKNAWRKEAYLRAAFLAGILNGDQIRAYHADPADYHTPVFAALRYAEEGKLRKARGLFSCAMHICVMSSGGIRGISGDKDVRRVAALRRAGAAECLSRLSGTLALLPEPRRAALDKKIEAVYPRFWKAGTLADDFAQQNAAGGGLAAYAAANVNCGEDIPKACYGQLPFVPAGVCGAAAAVAAVKMAAEAVPCSASVPRRDRAKALEVCQALVYSVDSGLVPAGKDPAIMRSDAMFEIYWLLSSLDRREEAKESLIWAVKLAPAGWKRLGAARAELEKAGV